MSSAGRFKTKKMISACVNVIVHDPYPIAMLENPAVRDLIRERKLLIKRFCFLQKRRSDIFLNEERVLG